MAASSHATIFVRLFLLVGGLAERLEGELANQPRLLAE
jgi:hypothetical protein